MKHSPIEDTDLISARKAAIAWQEEAEIYRKYAVRSTDNWIISQRRYPIFFLVGVLTGFIGVLITLAYVN